MNETNLEIGKKIKKARNEAKLTQEKAAEGIGVSRQTISNWENEKSYPDVISVIKMSDLYSVSLDYLLKGEQPMTNYYEYLEESTNTVKSNNKKGRLTLILSYLVVWAIAMIVFWVFTEESDAMGYSLMYLWVILPVITFVVSLIAGLRDYWGKKKWFLPVGLGIMYCLAEYGTFSLANTITFGNMNVPSSGMILTGGMISAIGIAVGSIFRRILRKLRH